MSNTINIEDFYTEENEKTGVWHEPVIDGNPCGLEFLIIGIHSDEAVKKMDYYDGLLDKLQEEPDEVRYEKEREIDAERVASITKDIRATNGGTIVEDGKPIEFSIEFMKKFYLNAPIIKMDNIEFAIKTSNFMKKQ